MDPKTKNLKNYRDIDIEDIHKLYRQGLSPKEVCAETGIAIATAYKYVPDDVKNNLRRRVVNKKKEEKTAVKKEETVAKRKVINKNIDDKTRKKIEEWRRESERPRSQSPGKKKEESKFPHTSPDDGLSVPSSIGTDLYGKRKVTGK